MTWEHVYWLVPSKSFFSRLCCSIFQPLCHNIFFSKTIRKRHQEVSMLMFSCHLEEHLHSKENNKSRWLWERFVQNHVWILWQRMISTWEKTVLPLQKESWCKDPSFFFLLCGCSTIDISLILHGVKELASTWLLSYLDEIWVKKNSNTDPERLHQKLEISCYCRCWQ